MHASPAPEARPEECRATPSTSSGRVGPFKYRYDSRTALPRQPANPEAWVFEIAAGTIPDPIQRREEDDVQA